MKAEFDIQVKTGDMYRFLMYHTYHGFQGIFSLLAGIALLGYFFAAKSNPGPNHWVFLMFGVIFVLYMPWTMYTQAVKQTKLNPVFKDPLHYLLTDEGISVTQKEATSQVTWENVVKVRETGNSILVYTGKTNACIWVKKQLGTQETAVREILKAKTSQKICKLK